MKEVLTLYVAEGEDGVRLDRWFKRRWPHINHIQLNRLARSGQIRIDGHDIASVLGLRQAATVAPYAASKAGLIQLTRELALEWARHGIRVNAIAPGYFLSDLNRDYFRTPAGEALVKRVPQRRLGEPADLDGAMLLLASDASRFMTGAVLSVDGGHSVSSL